jgi:SpoVK/Ycf46/Vps4 family AAA+-type ATPase
MYSIWKYLVKDNKLYYRKPGTYILRYNGRLIVMTHGGNYEHGNGYIQFISLWTLNTTLTKDTIFDDLAKLAIDNHVKRIEQKPPKLYVSASDRHNTSVRNGKLNGFTTRIDKIKERTWVNSIVTDENKMKLTNAVEEFDKAPDYYTKFNMRYKLCIMLSGPPGMGKTSVIEALAHMYQKNLYVISFSSLTDTMLPYAFNSFKKQSIVVFEDIDCLTTNRKKDVVENDYNTKLKEIKTEVTLSGFLNALDGVASSPGLITILTTNYPERLDDALKRQERVHLHLKFEKCTEVYEKMYNRFFGDLGISLNKIQDFAKRCLEKDLCLADIQAHCIRYLSDPEKALILEF